VSDTLSLTFTDPTGNVVSVTGNISGGSLVITPVVVVPPPPPPPRPYLLSQSSPQPRQSSTCSRQSFRGQ
jgi:hypothetical protein